MNKDPFQNTMFDEKWKAASDARDVGPMDAAPSLPTYSDLVEEIKYVRDKVLNLENQLQGIVELLYGH